LPAAQAKSNAEFLNIPARRPFKVRRNKWKDGESEAGRQGLNGTTCPAVELW
jgi:hypothetical protein